MRHPSDVRNVWPWYTIYLGVSLILIYTLYVFLPGDQRSLTDHPQVVALALSALGISLGQEWRTRSQRRSRFDSVTSDLQASWCELKSISGIGVSIEQNLASIGGGSEKSARRQKVFFTTRRKSDALEEIVGELRQIDPIQCYSSRGIKEWRKRRYRLVCSLNSKLVSNFNGLESTAPDRLANLNHAKHLWDTAFAAIKSMIRSEADLASLLEPMDSHISYWWTHVLNDPYHRNRDSVQVKERSTAFEGAQNKIDLFMKRAHDVQGAISSDIDEH